MFTSPRVWILTLLAVAMAISGYPMTGLSGHASLLAPASAYAANGNTILFYGPNLYTGFGSGLGLEVLAAQQLGYTTQVVSSTTWDSMTTAQFQSYRAIVIPDDSCGGSFSDLASTAATWNAAATGPKIVIGTDPVFHSFGSTSSPQYNLIKNSINFVASGSSTGAYIDLSCFGPASVLSGFGSWTEAGAGGCYESADIVASSPALGTLTNATLSNWGCSVHVTFSSWPSGFIPLAIATDGPRTYTSPTGATGAPYILASGVSVIGNISLTGSSASLTDGQNWTGTATVSENGSPVAATVVTFTVGAGPDTGTTGTATTNSNGVATWSFTGTGVGTDTVAATYVSSNGQTYTSSNVQVTWAKPADTTPPSTTVTPSGTAGTNGWYTGPVTLSFKATDPDDNVTKITYTNNGVTQTLTGAANPFTPTAVISGDGVHTITYYATDSNGNSESSTAHSLTLHIDGTPPTISLQSVTTGTTSYVSGRWVNTPVTATFACTDATSGPVSPSVSQTASSEGGNQTLSGQCKDVAGNLSSVLSVNPVNIDLTPPTLTQSLSPASPASTGWYNNSTGAPTVTYPTCSDALSGLATSCPGPYTFPEGKNTGHTVAVTDNAGNTTTLTAGPVNVDLTAPTVSCQQPDGQWHATDVTLTCTASDTGSGFASGTTESISVGTTVPSGTETANASTNPTQACDLAGNCTPIPSINGNKVDKKAPTFAAPTATANGAPYTAGSWTNQSVTVSFSCADAGAGVAANNPAPASQSFTQDGGNQQASSTCADAVGNSASTSFGPIRIDKTKPTITIGGISSNGFYNATVTPTVATADLPSTGNPADASGIAQTTVTLDDAPFLSGTPVTTNGPHTLVVSTTDVAGNTARQTVTFTVYNYPAGGTFALGDTTVSGSTSTSTVTFWGAQWAKVNTLSGGGAPSQFKGWIPTSGAASSPTCGSTYTSGPGNSTSPPATLPGYMAVVVSSSITKSGSTINGNVTKLVIVKTNTGYGPDPGQAGTGTIVATVCP